MIRYEVLNPQRFPILAEFNLFIAADLVELVHSGIWIIHVTLI
jgi:hypothetical protein